MGNLFKIEDVFLHIPELLKYLPISLILTITSVTIGVILGAFIAVVRIRETRILNSFAKFYVSFIRGTPTIIQLYIAYFGVPIILRAINHRFNLNISTELIPKMFYAIFAFGLNQSAYFSETFRAAMLSVDRGQIEAAYAIGMNQNQTLNRIIIPEAITVAIPTMGNLFIGLLKDTSLAFSVGVIEMTAAGRIIGGRTYRFTEIYVALAIIYWILTLIAERVINYFENKSRVPGELAYNVARKVNNI